MQYIIYNIYIYIYNIQYNTGKNTAHRCTRRCPDALIVNLLLLNLADKSGVLIDCGKSSKIY